MNSPRKITSANAGGGFVFLPDAEGTERERQAGYSRVDDWLSQSLRNLDTWLLKSIEDSRYEGARRKELRMVPFIILVFMTLLFD